MTRIQLVLAAIAVAAFVLVPAAAPAASSTIDLAAVFAGGGNSGATYANDYVELFNRSASSVDLTGWTLQYASSASTSWEATPLTGTIAAGGHYLVQLASNGATGAALPAADATGTTNLSTSGGKVAVVSSATALSCGATAGSCAGVAAISDLVGYGTATDYEGSAAAPALTNTNSLVRAGGGCTDTNDNAADLAVAPPAPAGSTAPTGVCGGTGGTTGASGSVAVALDLQAVLSLALDRTSISFGSAVGGATPSPVAVAATVTSNDPAGYSLTVARTPFAPADLPLGIGVGTAALAAVPVSPAAALQLASTTAPSAAAGDVWATRIGFVSALPALLSGHYTATVTYTVIAR
jgi:uncharacterized protein